MNRFRSNTILLLLVCFVLVFAGCSLFEGPKGPSGADGADGADGTDGINGTDGADGHITCLVCHSDENLARVQHEFAGSQHSSGDIAVGYAGGRSYCYPCHSHEQFVAFTNGLAPHNITSPSPWKCSTCHNIHTTFEYEDYALRTTEAASTWDGGTFLLKGQSMFKIEGNSNLCANCHQSRRAEPNITNPGEATFNITSPHYGPHHGAQANVLAGVGMAEIDGTETYPDDYSSGHVGVSCIGCHMNEGDHSFEPTTDACTDCHAGASSFDINGFQTEIMALLDELKEKLEAKGIIHEEIEEIFELDPETGDIVQVLLSDGYHPVTGTWDMTLVRAFFNWIGLLEDRSYGVHNPGYVKALLENSIAAVDAL